MTLDLVNSGLDKCDLRDRTAVGRCLRLPLRHVARLYPADCHKRVVLIIDNAQWHRGGLIQDTLADHPHLEFYRLPSYSPQVNVIERFWKLLCRRATYNRLFNSLTDLKRSLRASLCYFQTMRGRFEA